MKLFKSSTLSTEEIRDLQRIIKKAEDGKRNTTSDPTECFDSAVSVSAEGDSFNPLGLTNCLKKNRRI